MHCLDSFRDKRVSFYFPRPQNPSVIPVKEFFGSNPRVKVLPGLWIAGEEFTELIISEKVIATVDRLISNSHSWHVTDGRAAIPDESIRSINEVRIEPLLVLNFRRRIGGRVVIKDFLGFLL